MSDLEDMAREVHAMAVSKGWWDVPATVRIPRLLAWLHEEVEEAERAWAEHGAEEWYSVDAEGLSKPEGLGSELAFNCC